MQNSQKSKGRKPIFAHKNKNDQTNTNKLMQTTSSFLTQSTPPTQTQTMHINTHLVQSVSRPPVIHSNSVAKITIPPNSRTYSPQRLVPPQNSNIVISRPMTPNMHAMPVYRQPPNIQPSMVQTQFYSTQPHFSQNLGLTKVSSKFLPVHQNVNVSQRSIRTNELKPSVVAVERVMKPIGQNKPAGESTFLRSSHYAGFTQNIVEPEKIKVFDHIQRKHGSESQKISKLQEINGILSRNYDILLDEVQNLKTEQVGQGEYIDENTFIRRASNLFENLLNVEMHKALNQIQQLHKVEKRYPHHKKQLVHSFFR